MRQAFGLHRQHNVGTNAAQTDDRPYSQQFFGPAHHMPVRHAIRQAEQIDHAPEQHRFGELKSHHHQVGDHVQAGDAAILL